MAFSSPVPPTYSGFKRLRGDESNPTLGIVVDGTSRALHVCEAADVDTDWNVSAATNPTVYVHSATNPATEYGSLLHNATDLVISSTGGNISLDSKDLKNIGSTDNSWTSTTFTHKGTGQNTIELDGGSGTTGPSANLIIKFSTTGNAADTFGAAIKWVMADTSATVVQGNISFNRVSGADATSEFRVACNSGQTTNFKVGTDGQGFFNAAGTGVDGAVNIFDDYDDVVEIQRYAYTAAAPFITVEQRAINRERMIEMGVMQRDPDGEVFVEIQALSRLLAGGIYQNRWQIDSNTERIEKLELAVSRL
jgi:hypothetical protein